MPLPSNPAGRVIWITGLSGSGKSTLARELVSRLRALRRPVVLLDGDEMRAALGRASSHTREQRLELSKTYARLGGLIARQGHTVVVATISLFAEVHRWNRRNLPNYLEVYLKADKNLLASRDPKGIYRRARQGKLANVAGLDLAVEEPRAPHIVIMQTGRNSVKEDSATIMTLLKGARK